MLNEARLAYRNYGKRQELVKIGVSLRGKDSSGCTLLGRAAMIDALSAVRCLANDCKVNLNVKASRVEFRAHTLRENMEPWNFLHNPVDNLKSEDYYYFYYY